MKELNRNTKSFVLNVHLANVLRHQLLTADFTDHLVNQMSKHKQPLRKYVSSTHGMKHKIIIQSG